MTAIKKTESDFDRMGIGPVVRNVFLNALIEFKREKHSENNVWEICPEIRILIQVETYDIENYFRISIRIYEVPEMKGQDKWFKTIFHGDIPDNGNNEPDLDFISKILKNYKSFK